VKARSAGRLKPGSLSDFGAVSARRALGTQPGSLSDFRAGFGPKGLGNLAQALAWVGVTINATSPEGAEEIVI
jgi:hypothetical protein